MTKYGFSLSASAPSTLRPMHQLADVERTLDELEAAAPAKNAPLVAEHLDADHIWADRRKGRPTPTTASTLRPIAIDAAEIARRLGGPRD